MKYHRAQIKLTWVIRKLITLVTTKIVKLNHVTTKVPSKNLVDCKH